MPINVFRNYAPSRPPTERDTLHLLDGDMDYLGCLASTGTVVDNDNTARPFCTVSATGLAADASQLRLTLAGRVLMFQPDAQGCLLTSAYSIASANVGLRTLVTQSSSVTPGTTGCGPIIQLQERVLVIMKPTNGWVQWLPVTGTGNCYVWELL